MRKHDREKAIYLRRVEGLSLNEISRQLSASKSTVSGWVQGVKLTKKQTAQLDRQNPAKRQFAGVRAMAEFNKKHAAELRTAFQEVGRKECGELNLHLAGCMLFWAEGSKNRNSVRFTNTDAAMMCFFVRFLKECYSVPNEKIRVICRSHVLSPYSLPECESYWLKTLELNSANLRKGSIETRIPKVKNIKCPYGICSVYVNDTKTVQRIFGSVKQYAGIDKQDLWLD